MRVLVTGHSGYVGVVMTQVLRDAGHDVTGLDTGYYDGCNLGAFEDPTPWIKRDVREATAEDVEGFDAIVHLAALSNDPLGHLNPDLTRDINQVATVRLAKLAKSVGVERFIFASSCSLYGASDTSLALDETAQTVPLTPYARSKIESEAELSQLADDNFSPVYMRNATCYGASPRLRADVVLNNLVCWAVLTGKVRLQSDGRSWRPLLHVEDMSRAFAAMLTAPRDKVHNEPFNIGHNDHNYIIRDVAEIVRDTVPNCEVEFAEDASADARSYRVDFSKLARTLPDFEFLWDAPKGAKQVYDAIRNSDMTEEIFLGRRHVRLNQLKYLMETDQLDVSLHWK
jgi:nucleoside-diphosphate-sugar epimerase